MNCKMCGIEYKGNLIYCETCLTLTRAIGAYLDTRDESRRGTLTANNKKLADILWKVRCGIYDLPLDKVR